MPTSPHAAFYIYDEEKMTRQILQSGWDLDPRGFAVPDEPVNGVYLSTNENSRFEDSLMHTVHLLGNEEYIGVSLSIRLVYGYDFYIRFLDYSFEKSISAFEVASTKDGLFAMHSLSSQALVSGEYTFEFGFDLKSKSVELWLNDVHIGRTSLSHTRINALQISSAAQHKTSFSIGKVYMWHDYRICDKCFDHIGQAVKTEWLTNGRGRLEKTLYAGHTDKAVYSLSAKKEQEVQCMRTFVPVSGEICMEIKYHTAVSTDRVSFSLGSADQTAVCITDHQSMLTLEDTPFRKKHPNVWQTLRILYDSRTCVCTVFVNGKKGLSQKLSSSVTIDRLIIAFTAADDHPLYFTDLFVYPVAPEPADYVPAPILPASAGYEVGINVCSLWREGTHWGWEQIASFDDHRPYLGFYDEGLPETSDWELKWMAEHGITFQLYCWYNSEKDAPLISTPHADALEQGYMYAKYSDTVKFALIWEAANGVPTNERSFREYLVPYWIDHYFSDPRYATIDGKAVLSVFGNDNLIRDFGSAEKLKEAFAYLEQKLIEIGYNGLLPICSAMPSKEVQACGYRAVHSYSWAQAGCDSEYTKQRIKEQLEKPYVHYIPTVSTGFNEVAWADERFGQMPPEKMGEVFEWLKADVLPYVKGDEWKKKTVILSTWNEYGEGTYMFPSTLHGFGYLDEVRRAFTAVGDKEHTDLVPTKSQLERVTGQFDQNRAHLRRTRTESCDAERFSPVYLPLDAVQWKCENGLVLEKHGEHLLGKSEQFDPQMIYYFPEPLDAEDIYEIHFKGSLCTSKESFDEVRIFFLTEGDLPFGWNEKQGYHAFFKDPAVIDYRFKTKLNPLWKGKIKALRLDLLDECGSFDLESIWLIGDTVSPKLYINGKRQDLSLPLQQCSKTGEIYLPFDRKLAFSQKVYHEWNKTQKSSTFVGRITSYLSGKGTRS